jgi:hypothetical protein
MASEHTQNRFECVRSHFECGHTQNNPTAPPSMFEEEYSDGTAHAAWYDTLDVGSMHMNIQRFTIVKIVPAPPMHLCMYIASRVAGILTARNECGVAPSPSSFPSKLEVRIADASHAEGNLLDN